MQADFEPEVGVVAALERPLTAGLASGSLQLSDPFGEKPAAADCSYQRWLDSPNRMGLRLVVDDDYGAAAVAEGGVRVDSGHSLLAAELVESSLGAPRPGGGRRVAACCSSAPHGSSIDCSGRFRLQPWRRQRLQLEADRQQHERPLRCEDRRQPPPSGAIVLIASVPLADEPASPCAGECACDGACYLWFGCLNLY